MALCVALCASATLIQGLVKQDLKLHHSVAEFATGIQKAPAATQGLQYDATAGELTRYYNETDNLEVITEYVAQYGELYIQIMASDKSDCAQLLLFVKNVEGGKIPAGTYPINNTEAEGTAYASEGYSQQYGVIPCAYYPLVLQNDQLYISTPMCFMQSGNIVVEYVNNNLKLTIDAVNSNNVPVHIVYEVGGKSGSKEAAPLQYDAETGNVDRTYDANDQLDVITDYVAQYGQLYVDIIAADSSDALSLMFFTQTTDPEIGLPAGTYPISSTPANGVAYASEGYDAQYGPTPCVYFTLAPYQGQLAIDKLYFLVSGQIVVEKVNGKMKLTIDAVNSYDVPVKIVYNADEMVTLTYTSTDGNIVTPHDTSVFGANIVSNTYENGVGTITFDGPVTSIGDWAFNGCMTLKSILIPNSVTAIGYNAFSVCSSLTSIMIGKGVANIDARAFSSCQKLTSMVVDAANPVYDSRENCNAIIETATNTLIQGCQKTVIPQSVKHIGEWAFEYCKYLSSITIPNSVISIGECAFNNCQSLTSVTIPNGVTSIGLAAFSTCDKLTSMVVDAANPVYDSRENCNAIIETPTNTLIAGCSNTIIPQSIIRIGEQSFWGCNISSITIPNSVTTIGKDAFAYSDIASITIPNSVTTIGEYAFNGCSSLTSVTIPNSVKDIKRWVFANCHSLNSITLHNGITTIGDGAFINCSSLTSVTIPNSVTSIGYGAFQHCSSLTSIICLGTTPPEADNLEAPTTTCKLIVPHSAYNAYFRHAYWGQFLNIISGYAITLLTNNDQWGEVTGDGLYTNDTTITITATPYEGYTFSHWSDGNTDNPRVVQVTEDQTYTAYFAAANLAEGLKVEDYSYPTRADKYNLSNNWVSSVAEGNYIAPGTKGYVRGMAAIDGVMYFVNRELSALVPVDAVTGTMGDPILITGEHLFETETEVEGVMEWKSAVTLPFNDVKVDHAGNVLIGACLTNAQTFFVYKVDVKTGEATEVIKERLYDNPDFDGMEYRFDSFGVYGDVDGNACIMAASSKGMDVYRWIIEDGVAGPAEQILIQLDPEYDKSYNINATTLVVYPQIYPQDEVGSLFYVDGKDLYPMLIDEDGYLADDMINIPTGLAVVNNPGDTLTIDGGANGLIEFQVGDEYFFLMGASNFNKVIPSTFALFKFADAFRSFAGAEPLWYFPAKGFGDGNTKNGIFTTVPSVHVEGNKATIAVYSAYLGYASYTLTIDETVQKHQLTVLSNDNAMGTVSGSGTYEQGQSVTITATANDGYHFSHWSDGNTDNPRVVQVTEDQTYTAYFVAANLADGLKVEDYSYPTRADKYNLANNWVSSRAEGNFIAPGTVGMVRGMAMKDGVMYFVNRDLSALVPVDVATGQMGEPIFITGEHLFETETEVEGAMEWKSAVALPFNDVKVDHAGNILIGAMITNSQTFFVYKVNLETGEATEVIKERLYDNTDFDGMEYRFDAFGVYGDVDGNACIMAANGKGMDVYRWIIEDGVAGPAEQILIALDPELDQSYNIDATSLGTPPQILPQDEVGSLFYVDGYQLYPMLIDKDGRLVDDMINIPTGLTVVNNPGDTLTIDGAMNGLIEFQVGDEYFFLMAASNFNKSIPSTFALFKFTDAKRHFAGAEPLWYFPAKGLGDGITKNTCFTAPVSVHVEGNKATIAVYSQNLGYASYTLTIDETVPVETHTLTVLSNDNAMGSVSGSGTYKQGQSVTITATPNNGYHFSHWSDGNTDNPRIVEITQDTTFTAYFKDNLYTISVDANNSEGGFTQGSGTYKYGTYTEIKATANNGYHFSHWDDGNTDNPRVVQVTEDQTYTAYFHKNTYTVSVDYNSAYGTVAGPTSGEYLDEITLTATPNLGYVFVKWSDGVTTNPRTIVLTKDMTLSAHFAQAYSGQCGNDLYWKYDPDAQTIAITGSGEMYHYTASTQPWILFKEQIRKVEISNEATSLGTSAFEGCRSLGEVHIGLNLLDIYENAFAGCKRLYHIYSYPIYPPFADITSFANYSADVHIPCDYKEGYVRDEVWGKFNILCLGADTEDIPEGEVTTTTTSTSVTITWPTDENADSYTIEIKRGDQVFCTLTFSKDGQLTNIAFAPSRDGQHRAQYAELTANGLRFTVTNLNSGTQYSYDVTTKDENDEVIESYSGEFTTQSDVTTDNGYGVSDNGYGAWNIRKEFRNGQLIILRDGVEYNAMGQEL